MDLPKILAQLRRERELVEEVICVTWASNATIRVAHWGNQVRHPVSWLYPLQGHAVRIGQPVGGPDQELPCTSTKSHKDPPLLFILRCSNLASCRHETTFCCGSF
jgi:hypothetical protein